jgi:hypothetical protein
MYPTGRRSPATRESASPETSTGSFAAVSCGSDGAPEVKDSVIVFAKHMQDGPLHVVVFTLATESMGIISAH